MVGSGRQESWQSGLRYWSRVVCRLRSIRSPVRLCERFREDPWRQDTSDACWWAFLPGVLDGVLRAISGNLEAETTALQEFSTPPKLPRLLDDPQRSSISPRRTAPAYGVHEVPLVDRNS